MELSREPWRSGLSLVAAYAAFAAASILVNLAVQDLTIRWYAGSASLPISMAAGTAAGLLVKYYLDKRFIFRHRSDGLLKDTGTFALYALMGLATTAIFWLTEIAFHLVFGTAAMRYLGAAIGLTIGYVVKYRLDRRFVFRAAR